VLRSVSGDAVVHGLVLLRPRLLQPRAVAREPRLQPGQGCLSTAAHALSPYPNPNQHPAAPGGGSLLGTPHAGAEAAERGGGGGGGGAEREQMAGVDILYLKNVLLKFLDAAAAGRTDQVPMPPGCTMHLAAGLQRPLLELAKGAVAGRTGCTPHPCRWAASRGLCGSLPGRAEQQCQADVLALPRS
jgi:hypothetical protein